MTVLKCPASIIDQSLHSLRDAGARGTELVVLWLSRRPLLADNPVFEAYVPEQRVAVDFFHIDEAGMSSLMAYLRANRFAVAAQIHSHPAKAFHSDADDKWAITRHEGALSLVVPYFAAGVTVDNFTKMVATYRLNQADQWIEIATQDLPGHFQIA